MKKIGIISAIVEEVGLLSEYINEKKIKSRGMRDYYSGYLWGIPVVLVYSRMGKVAAAATAVNLIVEHDVTEIVFIGVAGSCSENINIGDIVIGKNLYQHDLDASPIFKRHEIPLFNKTYIETDEKTRTKFADISNHFIASIKYNIEDKILNKFGIISPKTIIGDIASGDQFISGSEQLEKIKNDLPTVLCVEMEGAAVGQVCYEYKVPCSVIRIISDSADENAHIDFQKFIDEIASIYSFALVKMYLSQKA